MTRDDIIRMAHRAVRMCADDGKIASFAPQEKTIIDNIDFLYWLALFAALDEREACAKAVEQEIDRVKPLYSVVAENAAKAIRARGQA